MQLVLKNIRKSYGSHQVLNGLNCVLESGIHGFLGANGVGKSTLFNILTGYITKDQGDIEYPAFKRDEEVLLSTLPQRFQGYPDMSIQEFMEYLGKLKAKNVPSRLLQEDIKEKLGVFGLDSIRDKKIKKLSGGQLRRLGIAQAFQLNPKIVLLDEPTTGLDPAERVRFKNYLAEAGKNEIILLSTHIVSDLERISKDIYILKDCNFITSGSEEELLEQCQGKVWEMNFTTEEDIERVLCQNQIAMSYERGGQIRVRFIADQQVDKRAMPVKPELNDVYISYFRD